MRPLFAYLDGASASAIVSMILGGVAAIGVALRYRWNQFLRFLHIRKDEETQAPATPPTAEAPTPEREPVETK
jgi:hypothetical protein